jgi:hypothetical protein
MSFRVNFEGKSPCAVSHGDGELGQSLLKSGLLHPARARCSVGPIIGAAHDCRVRRRNRKREAAAHCENGRRWPPCRGPSPHAPQRHVRIPRAASRRRRAGFQVPGPRWPPRPQSESAGPSPARLRGLPGPAEPPGPLAPSESPLVILRQVAPQLELGPLVPGRRCPARGLGVGGAMADGRRPGLAAREPGTSAEEQARWFTSRRSSSHWRLF